MGYNFKSHPMQCRCLSASMIFIKKGASMIFKITGITMDDGPPRASTISLVSWK